MKTLETPRLYLRPWQLEDAPDMYAYSTSIKVGPMAGWKPHESLEETQKIIQMFIREDETWAICLKNTKKVVGSIGLHPTNKPSERMLGYVLSEAYWGQGIAVEAAKEAIAFGFSNLGLDQISVSHFTFNTQSKRVIQKLGFTYVDTTVQSAKLFDGTVHDECIYRLTKEEFAN